MSVLFFPGIDDVYNAHLFERSMISVNRLWKRKSDISPHDWILDSGAFTTIAKYGCYPDGLLERYAIAANRWAACGNLLAAVTQDYMCETMMLEKTGLTIAQHQTLTIQRYVSLLTLVSQAYLMPVLQGYAPQDYVNHLHQYGDLLMPGQWVGVGSVCKRNSSVGSVESVLKAIKRERPDLKLHGFGIKLTSLQSQIVQDCLHSADSMAWSFAARYEGRSAHDPNEALRYARKVDTCPIQFDLFG
jgi:hypothetical protein